MSRRFRRAGDRHREQGVISGLDSGERGSLELDPLGATSTTTDQPDGPHVLREWRHGGDARPFAPPSASPRAAAGISPGGRMVPESTCEERLG